MCESNTTEKTTTKKTTEYVIERMATGMVDCNGDQIFTGDFVRVVKDYPDADDLPDAANLSIKGKACWVHNWSTGEGDRIRVQDTRAGLTVARDWEWSSWIPADCVERIKEDVEPGEVSKAKGCDHQWWAGICTECECRRFSDPLDPDTIKARKSSAFRGAIEIAGLDGSRQKFCDDRMQTSTVVLDSSLVQRLTDMAWDQGLYPSKSMGGGGGTELRVAGSHAGPRPDDDEVDGGVDDKGGKAADEVAFCKAVNVAGERIKGYGLKLQTKRAQDLAARRREIATAVLCAAVRADLGSRLWGSVSGNDSGGDREEIAREMDRRLAEGSVQLADALIVALDAKLGGGS